MTDDLPNSRMSYILPSNEVIAVTGASRGFGATGTALTPRRLFGGDSRDVYSISPGCSRVLDAPKVRPLARFVRGPGRRTIGVQTRCRVEGMPWTQP